MIIGIKKNKTIADVQDDFNLYYPFLKLEFYKNTNGRLGSLIRQKLLKTIFLNVAGNGKEGELEINDSMTVGQLEKSFNDRFGMMVQVSRKSGTLWLETTMTDKWTLKHQNEHGRELSTPATRTLPDREADRDQ
ncbi:MAG: hypothetical protein ABI675_17605 [Chitinophagaceae bacterium]